MMPKIARRSANRVKITPKDLKTRHLVKRFSAFQAAVTGLDIKNRGNGLEMAGNRSNRMLARWSSYWYDSVATAARARTAEGAKVGEGNEAI
jgi:hypothetical protein